MLMDGGMAKVFFLWFVSEPMDAFKESAVEQDAQ